jgi:Mn2+/Fe2+ NRAMP family transporter
LWLVRILRKSWSALSAEVFLVPNKLDPIKALVWSAIINGITAVPVMCFMMLLASNYKVVDKLTLPSYLKVLGWAGTVIMAVAAVGMFLTSGQ